MVKRQCRDLPRTLRGRVNTAGLALKLILDTGLALNDLKVFLKVLVF
jgi:hypothetical protein